MNRESPPDNHPEQEQRQQEAEAAVEAEIVKLDIGLDLPQHPELRSRLAEIGRHFEDSLDMARIIRAIYDPLKEKLALDDQDPKRLMRITVLHDIGKSGPPGPESPFHLAVRRLFDLSGRPTYSPTDGQPETIGHFVAEHCVAEECEMLLTGLQSAGIDIEHEPMIDFWRRHAGWTYDLLKNDVGADIDDEMIQVAASHHLLESQNPAHLELDKAQTGTRALEVMKLTQILAAVDKYQAFRSRGGLDHESAMKQLWQLLESHRPDLPALLNDNFQDITAVLEQSKEILAPFFSESEKE